MYKHTWNDIILIKFKLLKITGVLQLKTVAVLHYKLDFFFISPNVIL
jgi:hypothetical protein